MADQRTFIHAVSALGPRGDVTPGQRQPLTADPPLLHLREMVKKSIGMPLRQASHFVELAVVGSQLCLKQLPAPAPENTAVYLGSGFAEMRKNEEVFKQVMPPGPGMASPFDFINTANNMAAFYTARIAGFMARNLTISQEEFSFEWALKLAVSDMHAGDYAYALVGGVDENFHPRSAHLRRISLRDDQFMGEGSCWLSLSMRPDAARAELLEIRHAPTNVSPIDECAMAVRQWRRQGEPVKLLCGYQLTHEDLAPLLTTMPDIAIDEYASRCGVYPTAASFGIATALEAGSDPAGLLVHCNRNAYGHVMLVVLRTF